MDNPWVKSAAVGAAVAAATGWLMNRHTVCKRSGDTSPTTWLEIGHVDQLLLYPLKSGAPIRCTELLCTTQGPSKDDNRDRVLAVVTEDGKLVTGRDYPQLTQVAAEIVGEILELSAPGQPPFALNLSVLKNKKLQYLKIWKQNSEGQDCGNEAAAYLSSYVSSSVRLLYFPHRHQGKDVYRGFLDLPYINANDGGIFSDAMSFHVVNQASVRDLNGRLDTPVDARNFRPNIVIEGEKLIPYEEDAWKYIKIGDVVFRALAPCTRCLFVTVNPDSGEKSEQYEPVKTLRKYRVLRDPVEKKRFGLDPVMGVYLGLRGNPGTIHTGDVISVGF